MEDKIIIVQTCARDQMRRRVRKQINNQWEQMSMRALKAHDPSCSDPLFCNKIDCFKRIPDKIVSEPYKVER